MLDRLARWALVLAVALTVAYFLLVWRRDGGPGFGCAFAPIIVVLFIPVSLALLLAASLPVRLWRRGGLGWRSAAGIAALSLVGLPLLLINELAPAVGCAAWLSFGGFESRLADGEACLDLAITTRSTAALRLVASTASPPTWALERIAALDWPELTSRQGGVVSLAVGDSNPVLHLVGRDPRLAPALLQLLATRPGLGAVVARNPSTQPAVLEELSLRGKVTIDRALAQNPSCPQAVLSRLAMSADHWVRLQVAIHDSPGPVALDTLAGDSDWLVRIRVAQRPDLPEELRVQLGTDPDERVRSAAEQGARVVRSSGPRQ